MKGFITTFLAVAALTAAARDITLSIDTKAPKRNAYPHGAPCVGYAVDPKVGDEEAAIACRRAGAWLFRTALCDDATLEFCDKYGLRLFIILDGDQKSVSATLNRLSQSPHKAVIAALQLGPDHTGGADPAIWRRLAALVARQLPQASIALPVKDLDSPAFTTMEGFFGSVTHLIVDLRDAPAPYERLERIARKLRDSPDKAVSKLRLWAVGPGRLEGTADANISSPTTIAWQMHWIMSAFAVDRTDGVLIDRPYLADDFGLAMRHFWVVTNGNRTLVGHGEGATSAEAAQPAAKAPVADIALDDDFGAGVELTDAATPGPAPLACSNVAAGKPGDVEYLVLLNPALETEGQHVVQRVCLVVVNTTGERVKLSVNVNKNGGGVTSGWRRRLVPDSGTGAMRNSTRERFSKPLAETLEPGEITFLDFRI